MSRLMSDLFLTLSDTDREEGKELLLRMDVDYPDLVRSAFWWYNTADQQWRLVFVVTEPSLYYKHPLLARIDVTGLDDYRNVDICHACELNGINSCSLWSHNTGYRTVDAAFIYRCQLS